MKRPVISHILRNMVPLWISMLKLIQKKSLPGNGDMGRRPNLLCRVIRCGGSLETHSFRWAAPSSKNKRRRLSFVSGCRGRPSMALESFRVYHHVLLSAAEGVPCSDEGCTEDYYTAPSSIIMEDSASPHAAEFLDCANLLALCPEERKTGGFDAMAKYSRDPCSDFVRSIMEMIMAYSLRETHDLEALFQCYLRLNAPIHHPTITLAFLTALAALDEYGMCATVYNFGSSTALKSPFFSYDNVI